MPWPFSGLLLGFFHDEDGAATARKRTRSTAAKVSTDPCFVPIPSGAWFVGSRAPSLPDAFRGVVDQGFFDHSRAVASRNGRLVLELRHSGRAAGLEICVCNPMTGDMALLPPLSGADMPGSYACALLAGGGGSLCCVVAATCASKLLLDVYYFDPTAGEYGEWEWIPAEEDVAPHAFLMEPQQDIEIKLLTATSLRWFYERSGAVLFTLGEGSTRRGTFVFHIESGELRELVGGVDSERWKNVVGYEMDPAAYLASMASQ